MEQCGEGLGRLGSSLPAQASTVSQAVNLKTVSHESSKTHEGKIRGSKYKCHTGYGFWNQKPQILVTWTPWDKYESP